MLKINVNHAISLHQIEMNDAAEIFCIIDSERIYLRKWLPFVDFTKTVADTEAFIASIYAQQLPENVFVVRYENKIVGLIGFKFSDFANKKTEIGYWLSQNYQKKGIITLSVKRLMKFAFETMDINRIQLRCAVDNRPSNKVAQRLNFVFEGIERDGEILSDGEFTDLNVYSFLRRK